MTEVMSLWPSCRSRILRDLSNGRLLSSVPPHPSVDLLLLPLNPNLISYNPANLP